MRKSSIYLFTCLRILVGWHFLYESISKIVAGGWSSAPDLAGSKWIFALLFHWMAGNNSLVGVIDFLNIWGMILVGAGFMLGLFFRWAIAGGALMLFFYFVAYPPFLGYMFGIPSEGNYLGVNRNLIELFILTTFIFISLDNMFGFNKLYSQWR